MGKIVTLTRKRITVATAVESADAISFAHIAATVDNADRLLSNPLPSSFSDADRKAYFEAAIESSNNGKGLLSEWWSEMAKKYNIQPSARFDSTVPEFYELVDEHGIVYTTDVDMTPVAEGESITYEISGKVGVIVDDNCDGSCCSCKN